ncbi:hypothetical protein EDF24_2609 [Curtobacterium sp. PhB130]|uniref:hypothetical protein n=1 Tax=unclassified Curtobacterium TaxID=257496 RepID=UPI000FB8D9B6|nr:MULTISPECIES: hypothetical protein [unclassified Curtobacterium]ROS75165.1 hypothetical protein EDF24_2609 [Curtobacterium sp. PhB130]TCK63790.1 hypothetical protein EDF27_2337 [Curtobacterium sp. PhB136]
MAALLTLVYAAVGLMFRPRLRIAGMGMDSLVVVLLYFAVAGLIAIAFHEGRCHAS